MKKFLAALSLSLFATAVYAQCVNQTYIVDGRMTVCTTCCYGGNCTTTCI